MMKVSRTIHPLAADWSSSFALSLAASSLVFVGWENLDNNRGLHRAAFVVGGLVLFISGWSLLLITFCSWTGGWGL